MSPKAEEVGEDDLLFNIMYKFDTKICLSVIDEIKLQYPNFPVYLLYFYKLYIFTKGAFSLTPSYKILMILKQRAKKQGSFQQQYYYHFAQKLTKGKVLDIHKGNDINIYTISSQSNGMDIDKHDSYSTFKCKALNLLYPLYYKHNIENLVNLILKFIETSKELICYLNKNHNPNYKIENVYNICHKAYEINLEIQRNYDQYMKSNKLRDDCDIIPYLLYTFYCLNFPYKGYIIAAKLLASLNKDWDLQMKSNLNISRKDFNLNTLFESLIFICGYDNSNNKWSIRRSYGNTEVIGFKKDDMLMDQDLDLLLPYNMIVPHRLGINTLSKDTDFIGQDCTTFIQNKNGFLMPVKRLLSICPDIETEHPSYILLLTPIVEPDVYYIMLNENNLVLNYSYNILNMASDYSNLKYGCKLKVLSKELHNKVYKYSSRKTREFLNDDIYDQELHESYVKTGIKIYNKWILNGKLYKQLRFHP